MFKTSKQFKKLEKEQRIKDKEAKEGNNTDECKSGQLKDSRAS